MSEWISGYIIAIVLNKPYVLFCSSILSIMFNNFEWIFESNLFFLAGLMNPDQV